MARIYFFKFPLKPSLAGAELHTLKLARHFISQGHKVELISSDRKLLRLFTKNALPCQYLLVGLEPTSKWSLLLWPFTYLIGQLQFRKLVKEIPVGSIIFMQSLTEKLLLTPLLLKSPSPEVGEGLGERSRIIWLEHKVPGRWLKANPLRKAYLRLANQTKLITVSNFAKQEFMRLGVLGKNIDIIYPGVDIPSTNYRLPSTNYLTIGLLSRLDPEKGVYNFLKQITPYLPNHPNWQILIGGEGKDQIKIQELVKNNSQIQKLGFVEDTTSFFSQISVFVYPTLVPESFGIAVLEAMAHGKPVIASNLGALPELIDHQTTGFLVSPDQVGEIMNYLQILESDQKLYQQLSQTGQSRAVEFSDNKMFAAFKDLLL